MTKIAESIAPEMRGNSFVVIMPDDMLVSAGSFGGLLGSVLQSMEAELASVHDRGSRGTSFPIPALEEYERSLAANNESLTTVRSRYVAFDDPEIHSGVFNDYHGCSYLVKPVVPENISTTQHEEVWIRKALELEKSHKIDDALDVVYSNINDLAIGEAFETIDDLLRSNDVLRFPTDLLLGVLTVTRRYRRKLKNRKELCGIARHLFTERGEDAEELLANLDIT